MTILRIEHAVPKTILQKPGFEFEEEIVEDNEALLLYGITIH